MSFKRQWNHMVSLTITHVTMYFDSIVELAMWDYLLLIQQIGPWLKKTIQPLPDLQSSRSPTKLTSK
jgi:hypothetical protein